MRSTRRPLALVAATVLVITGCSGTEDMGAPAPAPAPAGPSGAPLHDAPSAPDAASSSVPPPPGSGAAAPRPDWLGTRVLPLAPDGFGRRLATPEELVDRRLMTPPLPDPAPPSPAADGSFASSVSVVPHEVAARSTWHADCPVALGDLRYVTVTFIGFDDRPHTGELLVHADVATDVTDIFAALHAARFPIEELRIIAAAELDAPPTGDGNVTSAFVCRATVGGTRWSDHASGRAIDVNPFHNPYVRGDLIIPELAGSYVARHRVRPGMIVAGDAVTTAFAAAGWGWGGDWTGAATDPMHFSLSGR